MRESSARVAEFELRGKRRLKLSAFAHVLRSDRAPGTAALWHSLTLDLCFVEQPLAETLQAARTGLNESELRGGIERACGRTDVLEQLLDAHLLVDVQADETQFPVSMACQFEEMRFIGVLYLMLFDGCNFACRYCFEDTHQPQRFRPRRMSREVAKAGLDLFARLTTQYPPPEGHEPKVQLYGGEPTLNWEVFRYSVEYFRELQRSGRLDRRIGIATVTNGTHMTAERAEFLAAHDVSIGISLDGPRTLNNMYRIAKNGRDTFEIAQNALRLLRDADAKVGVSVTLTPEVVADFDAVLSFLHSDLGVSRGLGFNILHFTEAVPVDGDYYSKAAACIVRAFQLFRDSGVWEDRAMRKVVSFVNQQPLHSDCAAIGRQIVVSPDGALGICQDYVRDRTGFTSNVFETDYDPFAIPDFLEWSRRSPLRMPQCYSCPALGICGGGCPASAEASKGSIWAVDDRICEHSRQMLNYLVWDTYEKNAASAI